MTFVEMGKKWFSECSLNLTKLIFMRVTRVWFDLIFSLSYCVLWRIFLKVKISQIRFIVYVDVVKKVTEKNWTVCFVDQLWFTFPRKKGDPVLHELPLRKYYCTFIFTICYPDVVVVVRGGGGVIVVAVAVDVI